MNGLRGRKINPPLQSVLQQCDKYSSLKAYLLDVAVVNNPPMWGLCAATGYAAAAARPSQCNFLRSAGNI